MGRAPTTASDLEMVRKALFVFGERAAYSWYEPKPFWYLYFSGMVKLVTGMFKKNVWQNGIVNISRNE